MIIVYVFLIYIAVVLIAYLYYQGRKKNTIKAYSRTIENYNQRNKYGKIIIATFIVLTLLVGLRAETVGIDTWNYVNHFNAIRSMQSLHDFASYMGVRKYREVGYWGLLFFLTRFNFTDWEIRMVFAIFSCIPVGVLIYKFSNSYTYSLFIYLAFGQYAFNFSAMRQGIAIGFIVWSIIFLIEDKKYKGYIFIALAPLFHITALVFAPVVILSRMKLTRLSLAILIFFSAVLLSLRSILMSLFIDLYQANYDGIAVGGKVFVVFLIGTVVLQYYYCGTEIKNGTSKDSLFFWLSMMTAIVFIFARTSPVYLRLALYYQIGLVITIPNLLRSISEPIQRVIGYWGYTVVGIYYFFEQICFSYKITPFFFVWQ